MLSAKLSKNISMKKGTLYVTLDITCLTISVATFPDLAILWSNPALGGSRRVGYRVQANHMRPSPANGLKKFVLFTREVNIATGIRQLELFVSSKAQELTYLGHGYNSGRIRSD